MSFHRTAPLVVRHDASGEAARLYNCSYSKWRRREGGGADAEALGVQALAGVGCGVWGVGCGVWGVGCGVWGAPAASQLGALTRPAAPRTDG